MNLPDGITYHPRQHLHQDSNPRDLIEKNRPALIRIETTARFPFNRNYKIEHHTFEKTLQEFLRGDWEQFDCDFGFNREQNAYARAIRRPRSTY
ncbi:MAG: hypothetical protein IPG76_00225 [Acidobacteria bacterium]|nr:hypothetical protein [Acidobacteriota bacterium]